MGAPALRFEDLTVWQRAHEFVLAVYRLTADFPRAERFALCDQMRRAAVSVPANIAEGFQRTSAADKNRFYTMAQGSADESRYFLLLTRDLGYGSVEQLVPLLDETQKMLSALMRVVARRGVRR